MAIIIEVTYNTILLPDDKLPDYELSEISVIGYKVNGLEIFIDSEKVEYSLNRNSLLSIQPTRNTRDTRPFTKARKL